MATVIIIWNYKQKIKQDKWYAKHVLRHIYYLKMARLPFRTSNVPYVTFRFYKFPQKGLMEKMEISLFRILYVPIVIIIHLLLLIILKILTIIFSNK